MNKAEEQYLYQMGRCSAQMDCMETARSYKASSNLPAILAKIFEREIDIYGRYSDSQFAAKGRVDYYNSILNAFNLKLITDWPSFVTHMTGETYEAEVTYTMKCTQCGTALNELMIGRCSQPSHEVPIVLCETCCQASPDCVGCKAQDCDGYMKEVGHE